jgi:NodT family efflux transporter outer membrane factor (OMF) lipoprotein
MFSASKERAVCAALSVAALMGALAGCAPVGPDFARPETGPNEAWYAADLKSLDTSAESLVDWWGVFNDPVLDRLVQLAHAQNNDLKVAGLRVLEARARLGIATGNLYPQTQVAFGDATRVQGSESGANTLAGDLSFWQYNLGVGATWEVDFWGRFRRGVEAADADLLASIASFDETLVLLTAQVADTYVAIRTAEEQLRIARQNLALQQRSYEIVDVLYRNGAESELDVQQALALLLSTQATIPGLETSLRQARHALSTLLGTAPGDVSELLRGTVAIPGVPARMAVGLPGDLLRRRPDVRRAELQAVAQNARVGIANADLYPSFTISGSLGLSAADSTDTTRTGATGLGELFRGDSITYSVGPGFVWPFLNYDRIRNNIRVQDARLQQALIQYRESVIQAAREVEDALAALQGAQQQDEILEKAVTSARRSTDLSLLRYQEGFADYQRVLDAQQRLFTQQGRYVANKGELALVVIALYRALGGGWELSGEIDLVDPPTRAVMQERTDWGGLLDAGPR